MTLEDTYKMLYSGYLGIREMDEYSSKEYILKEVDDYIKDYIIQYSLNLNFNQINDALEKQDLVRKLQDAIIVLNMIKGPLELTLLIRRKLKELGA